MKPRSAYSYRFDSDVPSFQDDKPIIIFDGYCALCSGWANFVLRHDKKLTYRLLAAQSPLGHALYRHYELMTSNDYETNILLANGIAQIKSEGSIQMMQGLGLPWSLVVVLRLLPLSVRDSLYSWVAKNRFKWFGRRSVCYAPKKDNLDRFLA